MTVTECAADVGKAAETVRRWIREGRLPFKKIEFRKVFVDPEDWEKFCRKEGMCREADR